MIGGFLKSTSRLALVAAAGLVIGGVASAQAADLGGDCCADLEERVAELEATTARKGNRKVSLTVSGHVNEAVLWFDDGFESNVYQVTNNVSTTRFRFVGEAKVSADWSAGYLLEVGVNGARSDAVDQENDDGAGPNALSIRHSAWWLQSRQLGKLWVGQTSTATDGITEINLANVTHFATENAAGQAGAFFTRIPGAPGVLGPRLNAFMGGSGQAGSPGTDSGQIGEGNRQNVVKYETPTFAGFIASAAWGEDDVWDVALRYAGEFNGIKVAFGVGYQRFSDGNPPGPGTNERNCFEAASAPDVDCQQLGTSGAIMHVPTGLYVHGAYGIRWDDNVAAPFDDTSTQWYVQAGIEQKFFPLGKTTIFGEYQRWDIGQTNAQGGITSTGAPIVAFNSAEMTMWGIGINQSIEAAAMDLYINYRNYSPEATVGVTAPVTTEFEDFQTIMAGGIIKF
jgi:predicted porin